MWAAAYTRIVIQTPQGGDLCPAVTLPKKAAGASDPPYGRLNILRMRRNAALEFGWFCAARCGHRALQGAV